MALWSNIFSLFRLTTFKIGKSLHFKTLFPAVSMDIHLVLFIKSWKIKTWKGLLLLPSMVVISFLFYIYWPCFRIWSYDVSANTFCSQVYYCIVDLPISKFLSSIRSHGFSVSSYWSELFSPLLDFKIRWFWSYAVFLSAENTTIKLMRITILACVCFRSNLIAG